MSISELWDNLKQANTCITRVPKNEEIMAKTFPNLTKPQTYKPKKLNEHPKHKKYKENYTQAYHNPIAWN